MITHCIFKTHRLFKSQNLTLFSFLHELNKVTRDTNTLASFQRILGSGADVQKFRELSTRCCRVAPGYPRNCVSTIAVEARRYTFRGAKHNVPVRIDSIRRVQVAEVGRKQMCRPTARGCRGAQGGGKKKDREQANELGLVVTLLRALMGSSVAVGLHGGLDSLCWPSQRRLAKLNEIAIWKLIAGRPLPPIPDVRSRPWNCEFTWPHFFPGNVIYLDFCSLNDHDLHGQQLNH